jgi:hypothetical protein
LVIKCVIKDSLVTNFNKVRGSPGAWECQKVLSKKKKVAKIGFFELVELVD